MIRLVFILRKDLDFTARTDLSAVLDLLCNRYNLYTKFYGKLGKDDGQYILGKEVLGVPNLTTDFSKLEYFFALTDSYHFPLDNVSVKEQVVHAKVAEALLKELPKSSESDLRWARLVIFLLGILPYRAEIKANNVAKIIRKLRDKRLRKALQHELKLSLKGVRPWQLAIRSARKSSKRNLKLLAKQLQKDGLLAGVKIPKQVPVACELVIFVPNEKLEAILATKRLKSAWEVDVDRYVAYYPIRDYTERKLKIRGMGSTNHPHPIYGLLLTEDDSGYKNSYYGATKLVLKPSVLERTIFTFGDTFEPYDRFQMTLREALKLAHIKQDIIQKVAKEKMFITSGKEVEAQILGGVTVSDIEAVELGGSQTNRIKSLLRENSITVR